MLVSLVFCVCFYGHSASGAPSICDPSHSFDNEGNIGESSSFPWLGVLRVHLYQGNVFKIAVTGIVLVKQGYAITNADDVARLPKRILTSQSQAMFIPTVDTPWYCKVKDYMTHPEYQFSTMSTVALLELDPGDNLHFPMKPICWPSYSYNASTELYAFGYTDEHQLLEKTLYKLQYVELNLCKEFYKRAGLSEGMHAPTKYVCGYAINNKGNCLWDNGMVLASNSSGYWKLLGFGVQGPGCSAPARFIDMISYFPWIESATDLYDIDDFRRSAFQTGFKKNHTKDIEDIPIHDVLRPDGTAPRPRPRPRPRSERRKSAPANKTMGNHTDYPFDTESMQTRYFTVEKIEAGVRIWAENISLPYKYGECSNSRNRLVYSDDTRLVAKDAEGTATYKITAYDLHELKFTCIEMKLDAASNGTATIYYSVQVDGAEGSANAGLEGFGDTPEDILKQFLFKRFTTGKPPPRDNWKPQHNPKLEPRYIQDRNFRMNIPNINILLRIKWTDEAHFKIFIYSPGSTMTTTTTSSSTFYPTFETTTQRREGGGGTTPRRKFLEGGRKREKMLVVKEDGRRRETVIAAAGSGKQESQFLLVSLLLNYIYK